MPSIESRVNNVGTLVESNSTLVFRGSFTTDNLGTINRNNGNIYLSGTLNNTNMTLTLDAASGSWILNHGTVNGGTIATSGGASFIVSGGTLDGVTINGTLDVGNSINGVELSLTNGLVLNGTMLVGNPTDYLNGSVHFKGSQSVSGSGTVAFGYSVNNNLYLYNSGTALTLGSGITLRGQNGRFYGAQNTTLINQGILSADVSGGTITVNPTFNNQGLAQAINGGTISLNGTLNPTFDTGKGF